VPQHPTPQQATAVDLIVAGSTQTTVAAAIGVSRQTLWRWTKDSAFEAELNRRRQEQWEAAVEGMRSLIPVVVDVFRVELEGPRRLRAAETLLHVTGFFSNRGGLQFRPYGPVSAEGVEGQRAAAAELDALLAPLEAGLKP
jgi:DNA-binding XRE family transcriptional regulator